MINSASAIERTVDKYYTSFLLSDAGILTPRTLVTEDFDTAMEACREMGDVVIKPLFGSEGKGMVRASDEETAYRVLRAWELNRYIYYIQEYLPHFRQDIRAFVIGEEVVAAMRRRGIGWKTNYSQGAEAEAVELSSEMKDLALKAARLLNLDYAGVDIIPAENGKTYVVEVNGIPGWRGLRKHRTENRRTYCQLPVIQNLKSRAGSALWSAAANSAPYTHFDHHKEAQNICILCKSGIAGPNQQIKGRRPDSYQPAGQRPRLKGTAVNQG